MSIVTLNQGILYPITPIPQYIGGQGFSGVGSPITLDATGEKMAAMGRIYIQGRAASKTIDTTGSSAIKWRTFGSFTFANGSTTVDVGLQGVATGAGPQAQPDGTFQVKRTCTGGDGSIVSGNCTTVPTSGTMTINHGDYVAFVIDMTNRAGADSFLPCTLAATTGMDMGAGGVVNTHNGANWGTGSINQLPAFEIVFNDGTLGTVDFGHPTLGSNSAESYASATNPNERGNLFQVPFDTSVDGMYMCCSYTDANSDFTVKLYSDPLGTPSVLASTTGLAENLAGGTGTCVRYYPLAKTTLTRNTDYAIMALATGSSNFKLQPVGITSADRAAFIPGGSTIRKGSRNGSSGAFTEDTATMYAMGVRLNDFAETSGGVVGIIGS